MHSVKVDTINQIYHPGVWVQKTWIKYLHYHAHCLIRKKLKTKQKLKLAFYFSVIIENKREL